MSDGYMQGDHDKSVAVPFSDDEAEAKNDSDLEEDKPGASSEESINRKQRRQERLQRLLDEGKQSKEEVANLRGELGTLKTELARLQGYVSAQPRPGNDNAKDPYEQRLDAVYDKQTQAYNAAQAELKAGTFTPERQAYYEKIAREVESEKTRIHTERVVDSRAGSNRAQQAQQIWEQKYPEVYQNDRAYRYAQATWEQRKALGDAPTTALVDEVMTDAMTRFKLGGKPAPSASDRARMSGIPSAGSGGSGGGRAAPVSMTPELKRMAEAAHPDLPQAEAWKKWVNTTGKRLRDKKVI